MSNEMNTIFNDNIAEVKLKQGTKYEKLAAIVFKILKQNDVVIHNLTLMGDGKNSKHQIDVTIQSFGKDASKRILIECKNYNSKIGISVVRDFFGVIHQIKPHEAFIVTTEGYTKGARTYAEEEGIKLAILRGFKKDDWEGRIKSIHLKETYIGLPTISWVFANEKELEKIHTKEENSTTQSVSTRNTFFYDHNGNAQENLLSVLKPIFDKLFREPSSSTSGRYLFDTVKYLKMSEKIFGVKGFDYEFVSSQNEEIIDQGSKVALLLFQVLNGEFDQIIFDQDLDSWTFKDNGEVITKQMNTDICN